LRPVDDRALTGAPAPGPRRRSHGLLAVDDEGCAVLLHQLDGRDAADPQHPVADLGRVGEELEELYAHGRAFAWSGRPGAQCGNGAYASPAESVSRSTPAPCRCASSD